MSDKANTLNKVDISVEKHQYIVGIGASAGGLEALQRFLAALPPNTGFPYILVQHLSPEYKSLLSEILGKHTDMPVIQAEDGMVVKPNHVYVIKPGKNMRIAGGRLVLTPQMPKELNLPVNIFFRSLAEEAGSQAIAIVFSGTGSDGSSGVKAIKEHDGMVIVQDPGSAKFDGMPKSALRTGLVDAELTPEGIAAQLVHIAQTSGKRLPLPRVDTQIEDSLLKSIYAILKQVSNANFTHYKQSTIMRRIERRMVIVHKDTLESYLEYLNECPAEAQTLSKEVLIGVTSFFRDPEYFEILKEKVITNILANSSDDDSIRVWVAGCSTGEEAYSIAILFSEVMENLKLKRSVKIFATDLDAISINTAGKGVFTDSIFDSVSPGRLSRYFTRKNNTYVINHDIRKMIVFSPHNVVQDPPFGHLDLISCRNMLIYFQPVLQNDLFALFHQALNDGGYLFLGKSEAIGNYTEAFPVIDPIAKIFTHRANVKIPGAKPVPFLQLSSDDEDFPDNRANLFHNRSVTSEAFTREQQQMDTSVLEKFMPTSLVVDEKNNIIRAYGDSSNFIHLPAGKFTSNLFDLIAVPLRIPASTILKEARERNDEVQYKDIPFHNEYLNTTIIMTAAPVSKATDELNRLFVLVLTQKMQYVEAPDAISYNVDRASAQRITDLEQNLGELQEKLSRSVADQECVSEELQSANEELLTANEELQSSNEELQSVNEELYTVNTEYQEKMTELSGLNNDIANFLSSTLIGIMFVDNDLNVRRYTDYVAAEFSLMAHDVGRSLKAISYQFPKEDIIAICNNVLNTLIPDERELITSKNKVFFTRVAPYRSTENKILGCVITLVDITEVKQGLARLESAEKRLTAAREAAKVRSDILLHMAQKIEAPMKEMAELSKSMQNRSQGNEGFDEDLNRLSELSFSISSALSDVLTSPDEAKIQ